MPATAPGYQKATAFLKERGHARDNLSTEDKSEFLGLVAAEYGRVASEAIRRADPNHLVLGCRFALYPGDAAICELTAFVAWDTHRQPPGSSSEAR